LVLAFVCLFACRVSLAGDTIKLAAGKWVLNVPGSWTRKQPKTNIIDEEFAVTASQGDSADGRVTVMGAGGSVSDNIDRWIGQFTQPDGSNTRDKAKITEDTVAGQAVHRVDISGTFKDQRGPLAPAEQKEKFRMLAAIVVSKEGNYFIKFYGPEKTIADHEKEFSEMLSQLKAGE
jgi:hypothetical protein